MNIYKILHLDNGDILLEKNYIDTSKYNIVNKDNGDILLKTITIDKIVCIDELKKYDFAKSQINSIIINNKKLTKCKYKSILTYIYLIINNGSKIIKDSLLNIKTTFCNENGFNYYPKLGISIQGIDSNKCLKEICNQCIKNNIKLEMNIKLNNNKNVVIYLTP
jgi:hypothetical protein